MNFSITTCLNKRDYINFLFIYLYKQPYYVISSIFGLCLLIISALDFSKITYIVGSPVLTLLCGLYLVFAPTLTVILTLRRFNSILQRDMVYTFSENGIIVEGVTFKTELSWAHILKQKEIGKFLVLYHNKKSGNFIEKSKLTDEQLFFIRSKVNPVAKT